jgi:hypothetical protein
LKYQEKINRAISQKTEIRTYLKQLKARKPRDLDQRFEHHHEAVFENIDCLSCANCCKTTSPIFIESDIQRLAKKLKMKRSEFVADYLKLDEDGDFVLQTAPCPFLGDANKCLVYDHRPKACREYPHTNRKRMHQILDLTYRNSQICPAVSEIIDRLKNE